MQCEHVILTHTSHSCGVRVASHLRIQQKYILSHSEHLSTESNLSLPCLYNKRRVNIQFYIFLFLWTLMIVSEYSKSHMVMNDDTLVYTSPCKMHRHVLAKSLIEKFLSDVLKLGRRSADETLDIYLNWSRDHVQPCSQTVSLSKIILNKGITLYQSQNAN